MNDLSFWSQMSLVTLLAVMGFYAVAIFIWQLNVLRGKPMQNTDGSRDDWREQRVFYGIALADLVLACPVLSAGIVCVFVAPQWGHLLLALASFWLVWANIMTTATSLRFERPKLTWNWIVSFPAGALTGLAYLAWIVIHHGDIWRS